jgi:hypothetical protein
VKLIATAAAYLVSLAVISPVTLFVVLLLAGPHSDLLPSWLQLPVLVLGWAVILVAPVLISRKVWRKFVPAVPPNHSLNPDGPDGPRD